MRRKDRELSRNEAVQILDNGEYGVLSMCSQYNEGYGIPLNYAMGEGCIYFHCASEGAKLANLKTNNKVSFCVVGRTKVVPQDFSVNYESAIAAGTVTEAEGDEKRDALIKIIEKYSGEHIEEGKQYIDRYFGVVKVLKLSIETVTGKSKKQ